jgi:hypothetical protein
MFEEERPHLQPLPATGMQYFTEVQRTVCDDSCVRIDHSSYAARPAPIGSKVLVRLFERRIEVRELRTQALLRTHARVDRPGTVVLPMAERVFNPSRETRFILAQARAIGPQAQRLCQMLFAIEGRVGQRKLWGIVNLAKRYPNHTGRRGLRPPWSKACTATATSRRSPSGWWPTPLAALQAGTADTVGLNAHPAARAHSQRRRIRRSVRPRHHRPPCTSTESQP